jgi:FtsH-binding integral membrane protein
MKKIAFIVGIVLSLAGFFQGYKYVFDYNSLTPFGKGYVWGSIILIVIGLVLIYFGLKRKTVHNNL